MMFNKRAKLQNCKRGIFSAETESPGLEDKNLDNPMKSGGLVSMRHAGFWHIWSHIVIVHLIYIHMCTLQTTIL